MASVGDFEIVENNIPEVLTELDRRVKLAMEKVGTQAVGRAVMIITGNDAVDTGLLRNSITYALGGYPPKKTSYHASRNSKHHKGGKGVSGSYAGAAPADVDGEHTVYIGTNVYYAPYVELGTVRMPRRSFIQPAVEGYAREYQQMFEEELRR